MAAGAPTSAPSVAELTVRAIVIGVVLSIVMGAANVYLGLKAGMTVSASIPAAVIGLLVLRALFGDGTILEANQVQTAASAGESLAAGIIFTVPALVLVGVWQDFDYVMTTAIAFTGGLLGILFMIPMRRVFVVSEEREELHFPEGVACAAVLEAGSAEDHTGHGARPIIFGALIGACIKLAGDFLHLVKHQLHGATFFGDRIAYFGSDISPALIGVGFIVRLNVAALIFIGGTIGWLICLPLLGGGSPTADPVDAAFAVWSSKVRYIGVGAMVVAGIASIIKVRHGLVQAVQELRKAGRRGTGKGADLPDTDRDISGLAIAFWAAVAVVGVGIIYYELTGALGITLVTTVIMVVMAFFFTAVASYIVGLVGNSNSPVSGMTITAVLFTGALLMAFGFTGERGILAILGVAAVVCCAACTSGDVCNDLKTGHIVGASPRRQQMMQILGVACAALIMAPVLKLLHDNTPGGIGGPNLAAPQAGLFASLAEGFFGEGKLPWGMVWIGAGIGVLLVIADALLERRRAAFRLHVMPVAVGLYLPFSLAPPILVGGILAHIMARGRRGDDAEPLLRKGVLFSSGVIAGESLMGVGVALLAAMNIPALELGLGAGTVTALTVATALGCLGLFWVGSRSSEEDAG